jgi:hypothetical protein
MYHIYSRTYRQFAMHWSKSTTSPCSSKPEWPTVIKQFASLQSSWTPLVNLYCRQTTNNVVPRISLSAYCIPPAITGRGNQVLAALRVLRRFLRQRLAISVLKQMFRMGIHASTPDVLYGIVLPLAIKKNADDSRDQVIKSLSRRPYDTRVRLTRDSRPYVHPI